MATLHPHAALVALLLLVACQPSSDDDPEGSGANAVPIESAEPGNDTAPDPDLTEPEGSMAGSLPGDIIPAPFRGRWGLTPADCDVAAGRAEGLLTIGSEILRFYESVAEPLTLETMGRTAISGSFAFSGEGMEWTREMTLTLGPDGKTLVRAENDPRASYTYTRCPT